MRKYNKIKNKILISGLTRFKCPITKKEVIHSVTKLGDEEEEKKMIEEENYILSEMSNGKH